jgi:hypothetical protein
LTGSLSREEKETRSLEVVRLALTGRLTANDLWNLHPYQRAFVAAGMLHLLSGYYMLKTDEGLRFKSIPQACVVDVLCASYNRTTAAKKICELMRDLGLITRLGSGIYLTLPDRLTKLVNEVVTIELIRDHVGEIKLMRNNRQLAAVSLQIQKILFEATLDFTGAEQGKAIANLMRASLPEDVIAGLTEELSK